MKYLRVGILLLMAWMGIVASMVRVKAEAEQPLNDILIVEVQISSELSSSDEFVEILNTGSTLINGDFEIQYMSATGSNWLSKSEFSLQLMPGDRFLVSTDIIERPTDAVMNSGLAAGGGHVRIVQIIDEQNYELDKVGWGTAESPETLAVQPPENGQSLKRLFDEDGIPIDSDNNNQDFIISSFPNPQASQFVVPQLPSDDENTEEETNEDLSDIVLPPIEHINYEKLMITELMVDPKSPQTDKEDEYVEIYNPSPVAVNTRGYVIETGNDFNYSHVLASYMLQPGEYLAIYSIDSGLTLSNSGGQARILSPSGEAQYTTVAYEKAKTGQSWSLIGDDWQWTTLPTPHTSNMATPKEVTSAEVLSKRQPKSTLTSTSTTSSTPGDNTTRNSYEEPAKINDSSISNSTLVVLGFGAILYFIYEYRQEIGSRVSRARQYIKDRRGNRS